MQTTPSQKMPQSFEKWQQKIGNRKLRMPAEWEPHEGTWLAWPHNPDTWPDRVSIVQKAWIEMVHGLHTSEKVFICVKDANLKNNVEKQLQAAGLEKNIFLFEVGYFDSWIRDFGPIFVEDQTNKQPLILDWRFNSWGGKYPPWHEDDVVPQFVSHQFKIPFLEPEIILEGGSIEVNGEGLLLTTEQCLLNQNRNAHLSKSEIEAYLKISLGVNQILWLGDGIVGDDTDGHIDDLTRFVSSDTVVTAIEQDPLDENYAYLQDNLKRLQLFKTESGKSLNIIHLPMPGPLTFEGRRLPASYANFYIGNHVVLVPTFQHSNDALALSTIAQCFPNRKIIGIDCREVVVGLGAIHCVTQQQPKFNL